MTSTEPTSTLFLDRPGGRIAYEVSGTGPVVVMVPGMGDLRSTYRHLAPMIVAAGYRVALTDLRGHGDSDAGFSTLGDVPTAGDVLALIEQLGGPAVVVGNSMGAGVGVCAAASRPDLVSGLVLVGPFVRDAPVSAALRVLMRIAMARWWVAATWRAYLPKLYAGRRPDDFDAHRTKVVESLHRPGYAAAFSATTRISHADAEAALPGVHAPTLVVMGEQDPDFPEPVKEAAWIAERLGAQILMVPESGHYPQSQRPDLVGPAIIDFLATTTPHA